MRVFAADDWGLSPGINHGILELASHGWLRSVSVLANAPFLEEGLGDLLLHAKSGLEVSLHFNLTLGRPLADDVRSLTNRHGEFHSHRSLLLRAVMGRLQAREVKSEFKTQLGALRERGLPVARLDGHHHVHLLPSVFSAIAPELSELGIRRVRRMKDPQHIWSYLQSTLIAPAAGPWTFEDCYYLLKRNRTNRLRFLNKIKKHPVLIHPSRFDDFANSNMTDSLGVERISEFKAIIGYMQ